LLWSDTPELRAFVAMGSSEVISLMSEFYANAFAAQDKWLSDNYLNSDGKLRLGALFMDLDALSGVVAYRHTGEAVTTVTAAFDRISLTNKIDQVCDLELSGQVTYVGKSSMEIELSVRKVGGSGKDVDDLILSCACTMVSLDPDTKKLVPICTWCHYS
jgi:acyl-coenzyme A thioesterase 9